MALTLIDLPLSSHGFAALISAEAAQCASEQDAYWTMHDAIYEIAFHDLQDLDLEDQEGSRERLIGLADEVKLDSEAMRECLESERYRPIIGALAQQALDQGVNVTPYLLITYSGDNTHTEAVPGFLEYAAFRRVLDDQYSRALGTAVPTATPPATVTPPAAAPDGDEGAKDGG